MVKKEAILYLETIHCNVDSELNGDDVYIYVYGDGELIGRYPEGACWNLKAGWENRMDIEIECTYLNEVKIMMWDGDGDADDFLGENYIRRGEPLDENNCGTRPFVYDDTNYEIGFRVITDPIPTVRILGIYCDQDSHGQDSGVVNAIANLAIAATESAATIIGLSPRPSRQVLSEAFAASAAIMRTEQQIFGWIKEWVEGADDVYMIHKANTGARGEGGAFFPPTDQYYNMTAGQEIHFEDVYGKYFRFPLDEGDVTIEFREWDPGILKDIIIGSIVIKSDEILEGYHNGIAGGSPDYTGNEDVDPIPGAMAVYGGPAVVEVANSYYGREDGAGALYYISYSVGTEDWTKPATTEGQKIDGSDLPPLVPACYAEPQGPIDSAKARSNCEEQGGSLPTLVEFLQLIYTERIPDSWPDGDFWVYEGYAVNCKNGLINNDNRSCMYTCKTESEDGKFHFESWGGNIGLNFSAPPNEKLNFAMAASNCSSKGGSLPTTSEYLSLIENGRIPDSWPTGDYWTDDHDLVDIKSSAVIVGADHEIEAFFSCKTESEEGGVEGWTGVHGTIVCSLAEGTYEEALAACEAGDKELLSVEEMRTLFNHLQIPASWPHAKCWAKGQYLVNIKSSYYELAPYSTEKAFIAFRLIEETEDEVRPWVGVQGLFKSPDGLLAYNQIDDVIGEDAYGNLLTMTEWNKLKLQGRIPDSWPKSRRYFCNIGGPNPTGWIDLNTMHTDHVWDFYEELYYYVQPIKDRTAWDGLEEWVGFTGYFPAPVGPLSLSDAQANCQAQGGSLPYVGKLIEMADLDLVPASWPDGLYHAMMPAFQNDEPVMVYLPSGQIVNDTSETDAFHTMILPDKGNLIEEYPGEG